MHLAVYTSGPERLGDLRVSLPTSYFCSVVPVSRLFIVMAIPINFFFNFEGFFLNKVTQLYY